MNSTVDLKIWHFQHADWAYLQTAIPSASAAGMNRIQLSHNITMDADELLDDASSSPNRQMVANGLALAHQHGLKADIWVQELINVPQQYIASGKIKFSPDFQRYLERKYDRLFLQMPDIDGLVLTFNGSSPSIFDDSQFASELPVVERIARITESLSNVCERKRRPLFIHTSTASIEQQHVMERALAIIEKRLGNRQYLMVINRYLPFSWNPIYPFTPLVSRSHSLRTIIELDLGNEFTGNSSLPYIIPQTILNSCELGCQNSVVGISACVDYDTSTAFGTLNEANINVFSSIVQGTEASADALFEEWCQQRFGDKAAAKVASILLRSSDIVDSVMFPMGMYINEHSMLSGLEYGIEHITDTQYSCCGWITSPHNLAKHQRICAAGDDVILQLHSEKEYARELCRKSIEELSALEGILSDENIALLTKTFELMKSSADIAELHQMALFRILQLRQAEHNKSADDLAVISQKAQRSLQLLLRIAPDIQRMYGDTAQPANPQRIEDVAQEYLAYINELNS